MDPDLTPAYYHLISKSVNGEFLFHDADNELLRRHVWLVADRYGVVIITYELMNNHFHIVALAPKREPLPDQELLRRHALLHPVTSDWAAEELDALQRMLAANGAEAEAWRQAEQRKASNISEFMKLLKQRFSLWFNRKHDRFGTLWYERFKSVLLEPGRAVRRCMAYVNTNAVRARICRDPTTYRFGAYAEALSGSARAQAGIMHGLGVTTWAEAIRLYRRLVLAGAGSPEESEVLQSASKAPRSTGALQRRCRCFSNGGVIGSESFVAEHIARFRERTGMGQRTRPRHFADLGAGLVMMRGLRGQPAVA